MALCLPGDEGAGEAGEGGGGGEVIEVRAYEEGGEPRGDEARPEPRLQPRRRGVFTRKRGSGHRGGPGGAAGSEAETEGQGMAGDGREAEGGGDGGGGAREERTGTEGGRGAGWWRGGVIRRREAGKTRERSARKNEKRAARLGAEAARWGSGRRGSDAGSGASENSA